MLKLSDIHTVLLSTASQRDSGSVCPLPSSLSPGTRLTKALATLVKHGLAVERETAEKVAEYRRDGDLRYGLFLTSAGLRAIGVEIEADPTTSHASDTISSPRQLSKIEQVLVLLRRESGATIGELIEATGWLPHTTRAALTGLRKKGWQLERSRRADITSYRLVSAA